MPESTVPTKKLQWKWIGISIVLYAVFYVLSLVFLANSGGVIAAIGVFAGIILVAAVAGFLSEGVTLWEPAIADAGLMLLFLVGMLVFIPRQIDVRGAVFGMTIVAIVVFLLSLLGAWFGERAKKLWRTKPPESVPKE